MADESLLRFRLGQDGAAQTLHVSGELDIASAPALEPTVAGIMDGQDGEFCLDVSALTFMDSTARVPCCMSTTESSRLAGGWSSCHPPDRSRGF
jgi:ABC-type transporter Mla MlaB component